MTTKKYILKPGRHQFVPGSHAFHQNNNLTDEEAQWYLAKYLHIALLFDAIPEITDSACRVSDDESFKLIGEITSADAVESIPLIGEIIKTESVESQTIII